MTLPSIRCVHAEFLPVMRRLLVLSTAGLIGGLLGGSVAAIAGETTQAKGARIYCFMRSSGNDHNVSWNAAYALIKRQGRSMFKTSPEHASVMITEAVVNDPGSYPDCGRYLGDLFGGSKASTASQKTSSPNISSSSTTTDTSVGISTSESMELPTDSSERYSY